MDASPLTTTKWSQITSQINEILYTPLHDKMTAVEKKIHEAAIFLADLHKKYPLDNLTRSDRHPNEHYMKYITELIEARDFETAAVFARLQLRGFDGVVENKNVWTEYIAYVIKHHKKNESSIWKPFIQKLIVLIEEEIIYLRNCLDRPIVFTTFFKLGLNTLEKWKYDLDASTPQNWLLLILRSSMSSYTKTDLIRFLRKIDEKYIPIDAHSVKLIMIYGNTRIFKEWLQISDFSKMQFDNGRNILHEILELRDGQYRDYTDKFEDKLFQRDNKGIYPIEFILRKPSLLLNPKISAVFSRIANQDYAPHYAALKKRFDSLYTGVSLAWAFRSALEGCFNPEDPVNPNFRSTWIRNVKQSGLEEEFPLHNLPLDILCVISEYLSLTTAMSLTMVSKTVHQYFRSDPSFYKRMIQMTRPSIYKQKSIKEDVNWDDLAKNHSRIEYRWNNSTPKSTKIHSYLFSPRSLGRRNQIEAMNDDVLVSCPNLSKLLVYSIHTMKILHSYDASFNALHYRRVSLFQSNAGQDPYLFSVKASELFVYHNGTKYSQNLGTLPRLHMAAIALNERTVLLENANLLWDVEAAKISMKIDINPTSLNSKLVTVPALYNDRSKLLALSTNSELHFVDLRTGKSIWKIEKETTSMGFMDDGRLILGTNQFHGYMLWDLREEHWRKVEFRSEVMKINSYAAVGRYKTGLMIEHF